MPETPLMQALAFVIDTAFWVFMLLVLLRLLLPFSRWDPYHPLVHGLLRLTQPPIAVLQRLIPRWRKIDGATLVLLFALSAIKISLLLMLQGYPPTAAALLRWVLSDVLTLVVHLFTVSILLAVVLSWLSMGRAPHPMSRLLDQLNAPLINPIRKRLPHGAGLDFSPLVALLGLQVVLILLKPWLLG